MVLDRSFPARERCGKLALSLVASFAVLAPIAESPAQHIEDGRLVYPERRVAAATYKGADEEVVRATALKITTREGDSPGSWVYEWRTLGEYYEQIGDVEIEAGHRVDAREAYLQASVYYGLAWFPGNYTPEERLAYGQQLSVYRKAGALFDAPLEVVNVPFRESHLITYVHRPAGIEKPPLVIWTGGSDQYKANHYRPI
ncbi:MAG: alpha/beta hydrolase, partial [Gammaproteobacteria bacterium]